MESQNYYNQLEDNLKAIPAEDVKRPSIPIKLYTNESESLNFEAINDRDDFITKGINVDYLDSLDARVGALRHAQAKWKDVYKEFGDKKKLWLEKAAEARRIHRLVIHSLKFIAHNDASLKSKIDAIVEGSGDADLIQDLADLGVLASSNEAALAVIGYDTKLTEECSVMADELANLLAEINGNDRSDVMEMRNRAYTYLKEAVDEIKRYGKYVFWEDKDRKSIYFRAFGV